MNKLVAKMFCLLVFAGAASVAQASPLVANGDFSAGDFSGWNLNKGFSFDNDYVDGNQVANFSSPIGAVDTLSQTINTKANTLYSLTFDFGGSLTSSGSNSFSLSVGGKQLYSASNVNFSLTSIASIIGKTLYFTASGPTTLAFAESNMGGFNVLDNVVVNEVSAVPLPASGYLMLSALGIIGFMATRRSNKAAGGNFA